MYGMTKTTRSTRPNIHVVPYSQQRTKKTVFITVDGRRKGNATGVSIAELTHLIRILGGHDALNLDGGGSTTLWLEGAPENGVLNSPSDNGKFDHQGERKIPNIIYVYK